MSPLPLLLAASLALAAAKPEASLPERFRKWLDEDVVYIISDKERDAFLGLKDDATRDTFIEAFWEARDPTPGTVENEYRTEHYKRIAEANKLFGRGKDVPGWKTTRGRTYVQLGEPRDRQRWIMEGRLYPMEDWFYEGDIRLGLPRFFHVLFFQQFGVGDYKVYDPVIDGPESLVGGDFTDRTQALKHIGDLSPELARVTLSLIPFEPVDTQQGIPSAASSQLVARLADYPNRQPIDTHYAESIGKPQVSVEYSFKNLGLKGTFHGAFTPEGRTALHYLVEVPPESLTLTRYDDRLTGALEVVGRVLDGAGKTTVLQIDERIEIALQPGEFEALKTHPFGFEDVVPLLPGSYQVDLAVRNLVSKQFGLVDGKFEVPERPASGLAITPVLLSAQGRPVTTALPPPFTFGEQSWYPARDDAFPPGGEVNAVFQIAYPAASHAFGDELNVRYLVSAAADPGEERLAGFERIELNPAYDRGIAATQLRVPLRDLPAGGYLLRLEVRGGPGETAVRTTPFTVRADANLSPGWIQVKSGAASPGQTLLALAEQYLQRGDEDAALQAWEESAGSAGAAAAEARLHLAEVYLRRKDYPKAVAAVVPIAEGTAASSYSLLLLGLAQSGLGKSAEAIHSYERALAGSPKSTRILNVLAEERLRAGEREQALAGFRRSLEVDPDQPKIAELVKQLAGAAAAK